MPKSSTHTRFADDIDIALNGYDQVGLTDNGIAPLTRTNVKEFLIAAHEEEIVQLLEAIQTYVDEKLPVDRGVLAMHDEIARWRKFYE